MKHLWILRGPRAGTFETLPDDEADALIADDAAQLLDGSALRYPENHPHYGLDVAPKNIEPEETAAKKTTAKKRYQNKMLNA